MTTVTWFDELGRATRLLDGKVAPVRELSTSQYELDGTLTSSWSARDGQIVYAYDSYGRLLSETRKAGGGGIDGKTSYVYEELRASRDTCDTYA